ncbi:hypothetical protein CSOJ01_11433 [Colletotrichum sojae]|uniref:Uncharacterized protein n=1 Tax=Colletotrichum sojae TaxID=2175907 RepID=A0A8H6IXF1_9PEZI|nr:hypothetical protein CSOJ01_11433 [Colletotrichum sojae]
MPLAKDQTSGPSTLSQGLGECREKRIWDFAGPKVHTNDCVPPREGGDCATRTNSAMSYHAARAVVPQVNPAMVGGGLGRWRSVCVARNEAEAVSIDGPHNGFNSNGATIPHLIWGEPAGGLTPSSQREVLARTESPEVFAPVYHHIMDVHVVYFSLEASLGRPPEHVRPRWLRRVRSCTKWRRTPNGSTHGNAAAISHPAAPLSRRPIVRVTAKALGKSEASQRPFGNPKPASVADERRPLALAAAPCGRRSRSAGRRPRRGKLDDGQALVMSTKPVRDFNLLGPLEAVQSNPQAEPRGTSTTISMWQRIGDSAQVVQGGIHTYGQP